MTTGIVNKCVPLSFAIERACRISDIGRVPSTSTNARPARPMIFLKSDEAIVFHSPSRKMLNVVHNDGSGSKIQSLCKCGRRDDYSQHAIAQEPLEFHAEWRRQGTMVDLRPPSRRHCRIGWEEPNHSAPIAKARARTSSCSRSTELMRPLDSKSTIFLCVWSYRTTLRAIDDNGVFIFQQAPRSGDH